MYLGLDQAKGHIVQLARSDVRHLPGTARGPGPAPRTASASRAAGLADVTEEPTTSFGELFFRAFDRVNQTQVTSNWLAQAMITDPASVDIHDVTIAMAEANLAISMTKNIVDRAVQAYRAITTLR